MLKNDKMKLGRVRFKRYKKFLKCFDKNAEELKKDSDLLMKMLGKQVEAFNSDEERKRQAFEAEWKQINERWVKAQNEKELQAQKELLLQKDEQIINQQEKIVSLVKLLKSLGKTTLEIEEATGLSTDEIQKM